MFLSTLLIDTGGNPDRPRPGRLWLRNLYRVHQRLCMAFPCSTRRRSDQMFLMPYAPSDFAQAHVHVERGPDAGFLFRVDPQSGGGAVIIVLSALPPDWEYAFRNAAHLLAAPLQEPRHLHLDIAAGEQFRFRLLANPTKRPALNKDERLRRTAAGQKVNRPRQQLTWDPNDSPNAAFNKWLERRAAVCGFNLRAVEVSRVGYVYINKGRDSTQARRLRSVQFDGLLAVTDANIFLHTLAHGIGPGKAFGFGLLSIAPAG